MRAAKAQISMRGIQVYPRNVDITKRKCKPICLPVGMVIPDRLAVHIQTGVANLHLLKNPRAYIGEQHQQALSLR